MRCCNVQRELRAEIFGFEATKERVEKFMKKVPEGSSVVIETSTTGKALSMKLAGKYDVHMIDPLK